MDVFFFFFFVCSLMDLWFVLKSDNEDVESDVKDSAETSFLFLESATTSIERWLQLVR